MSKRIRNFCATINNYTEKDIDDLKSLPYSYLIFGKEIAPTTNTPHLQIYVELSNQTSFSTIKKILPTAHIENRKGTGKQASDYCKKDKNFEEYGELKIQGKRTDLIELKDKLLNKELKIKDILLENPIAYHTYGRTLDKIEATINQSIKRTEMTEGIWIYGDTGTGKSHYAYNHNPDYYDMNLEDNGWCEGYTGQHTFIINDFRGEIKYATLLKMVDKWDFSLKRRGNSPVPFTSKCVIITSSLPPEEIYHNLAQKDSLKQLYRRFKVLHLKNKFEKPVRKLLRITQKCSEGNTKSSELLIEPEL